MEMREWHGTPRGPDDPGGNEETTEELERLRRQGQDLLSSGADVIARALSGDSEQYLRSMQQEGGQ